MSSSVLSVAASRAAACEPGHPRDLLRARGDAVGYSALDGGHDDLTWRESLADGLIALAKP